MRNLNKDQLLRFLNQRRGEDWIEDILMMVYLSDKLQELALSSFESESAVQSSGASDFVSSAVKLIVEDLMGLSYVHGDALLSATAEKLGSGYITDFVASYVRRHEANDVAELRDKPF